MKPRILVVEDERAIQIALAGLLGRAGYEVSIAAQGGINAAKNYKGDGDSVQRLFYDTVKGGDFRSREANVHRLAEVSLGSVIDSALETLRERIDTQRVRLVREDGHDGVVRGDAEKLRRVVINLVGNALDALAEGGAADPTVEVLAGENLAGTECWLRVRDNGPGIDARALAQIWSPFYSSKASGTGLGLAIAKKVVEAHGGTIEAASQPGAGAEFTIALPKANPENRS